MKIYLFLSLFISSFRSQKVSGSEMVKQAAEKLKPVMNKSGSTRSRAGVTLSIDNSVMDRFGKLLRCTYNWLSGRHHKVVAPHQTVVR